MKDRVRIGGLVISLLVLASCRSPHPKPLDVTLLTGERVCIDEAVDVAVREEKSRGAVRRPMSIEAKLASAMVKLEHAPASDVRPGLDDIARWIERYPASKVSIDSGQLIWVNAAIRERASEGNRTRKAVLGPGNGVWSLVVRDIAEQTTQVGLVKNNSD